MSIAAEIGIGVAGFSSIVAAILTRSGPGNSHAQWLQFRTLLITSFGVTLLAYIPMVLGATTLSESKIWLVASSIYFVWVLFHSVMALKGKEMQTVLLTGGATRRFALVSMALVAGSLSLNLGNALVWQQSWPYLTALACGVSIAFIQFGSLLRELWLTEGHLD